ncbi:hypothetical protein [Runella sp.]|jgi:hypothetical protein|uniref:hypothetical protein n=1 Tax=Runella sp. TaxID=1960881 RepID=UPI0026111676|nr:hypothetical protein [Runella sp.]
MSTAQSFYEVFKALPKKVQIEVLRLLENEKVPLLTQIDRGLQDVKKMQEGTSPKRNIRDLVKELRNE